MRAQRRRRRTRWAALSSAGRPRSRRLRAALACDVLPSTARSALRPRGPQRRRSLRDLVVGRHLDAIAFRGGEDLAPRALFRALRFELGLIEARHRVTHVRLVLDREVLLAVRVDVRELVLGDALALAGGA